MISLGFLVAILLVHWLGDFVFQRHEWAMNKSTSNVALGKHVLTYSLTLLVWIAAVGFGPTEVLTFVLVNGVSHFLIDYVTSRLNSKLWAAERVHDFFVSVGFDQVLHYTILFASFVVIT